MFIDRYRVCLFATDMVLKYSSHFSKIFICYLIDISCHYRLAGTQQRSDPVSPKIFFQSDMFVLLTFPKQRKHIGDASSSCLCSFFETWISILPCLIYWYTCQSIFLVLNIAQVYPARLETLKSLGKLRYLRFCPPRRINSSYIEH